MDSRMRRQVARLGEAVILLLPVMGCPSSMTGQTGPDLVTVPYVVGKSWAEAETAIANARLAVGTVNEEFNDAVPAGNVISQDPAGGSVAPYNSSVDLLVSKGPGTGTPDVVGLWQVDAPWPILDAGLYVDNVTEEYSATVPAGIVLRQDPKAGTTVPLKSGIDLVLSKGPGGENGFRSQLYGGEFDDLGTIAARTLDGGLAFAGSTNPIPGSDWDVYLVRTDAAGNPLGEKRYGGSQDDLCEDAQRTSDGGFMLAGITKSFTPDADFYLIKTDASGTELWSKAYGGSGEDRCYSAQETSDGGFILGGKTHSFGPSGAHVSNMYLVKTDADGKELWARRYRYDDSDPIRLPESACYSVRETSDGGFILGGYYGGVGEYPYFCLVKTDADGNELWWKQYKDRGAGSCHSARETSEGGYVLGGYIDNYPTGITNIDAYIVKTDANGTPAWTATCGGRDDEYVWNVEETSDGGYVLAGSTQSFYRGGLPSPISYDAYAVKLDATGNQLWSRVIGGSGEHDEDYLVSVVELDHGGFVFAGVTNSFFSGDRRWDDIYVIWLSKDGS